MCWLPQPVIRKYFSLNLFTLIWITFSSPFENTGNTETEQWSGLPLDTLSYPILLTKPSSAFSFFFFSLALIWLFSNTESCGDVSVYFQTYEPPLEHFFLLALMVRTSDDLYLVVATAASCFRFPCCLRAFFFVLFFVLFFIIFLSLVSFALCYFCCICVFSPVTWFVP